MKNKLEKQNKNKDENFEQYEEAVFDIDRIEESINSGFRTMPAEVKTIEQMHRYFSGQDI